MRAIVIVPVLFLGMASVGCNSQNANSPGSQQSTLTSIDVNLPAKKDLPKGLQATGLSYCFSVRDVQTGTAYREGEPVCMVPYSPAQTMKKGLYEGAVSLGLKLDSSKSYELSLVVGYERAGMGSAGTSQPVREATTFDSDTGIDLSKLFYHGIKYVQSQELQGKSNLKVSIKLNKFGSSSGDLENETDSDSIITPSSVDLEVQPIFIENDNENGQPTT